MARPSDDDIQKFIYIPIQTAQNERDKLIPILGAGISLPLGTPSWQELQQILYKASSISQSPNELPRNYFLRVRQQMPLPQYETVIQQHLSTTPLKTTLALQAIVNSRLRILATTNLDFSIERAFSMAGLPLNPENVVTGTGIQSLNFLINNSRETILVKLHGSLESPKSWVLDKEQYDKAYRPDNGVVQRWWSSLNKKPLFIGFSFSDDDISEILRWNEVIGTRGGYCILPLDTIRDKQAKLEECGISPIGIINFEQLPEVIDDIFRCSKLRIEIKNGIDNTPQNVTVGATFIDLPLNLKDVELSKATKIIANAVDYRPLKSMFDAVDRREYGPRGAYVNALKAGLETKEDYAKLIVRALQNYPDVFLHGFLPIILKTANNLKTILPVIWEQLDDVTRDRSKLFLLQEMTKAEDLSYRNLRDITWFISHHLSAHPASSIPPIIVAHPNKNISICRYPITNIQAGILLDKSELKNTNPVRPYTLNSKAEMLELIEALNKHCGEQGTWRLPTEEEWIEFEGIECDNKLWPWGDEEPEPYRHAHLNYKGNGGPAAHHPLDVGIFPEGVKGAKIIDLIGNVYEIAINPPEEIILCGGAWTSSFPDHRLTNDKDNKRAFSITSKYGRGKGNVGIRPILESS